MGELRKVKFLAINVLMMGYAIIRAGAAIVTTEMAMAMRKNIHLQQAYPNYGRKVHDEKARFCKLYVETSGRCHAGDRSANEQENL